MNVSGPCSNSTRPRLLPLLKLSPRVCPSRLSAVYACNKYAFVALAAAPGHLPDGRGPRDFHRGLLGTWGGRPRKMAPRTTLLPPRGPGGSRPVAKCLPGKRVFPGGDRSKFSRVASWDPGESRNKNLGPWVVRDPPNCPWGRFSPKRSPRGNGREEGVQIDFCAWETLGAVFPDP